MLVSFLDTFESGFSKVAPSLTDDPDISSIDNRVTCPIDLDPSPRRRFRTFEGKRFTQLLNLSPGSNFPTLDIAASRTKGGRVRDNFGYVQCRTLSPREIEYTYIPYRLYTSTNADKTVPVTEYGLYGDRYTSADGSTVTGVVHVPGGPRESPAGTTPTNNMLLPFPIENSVDRLLFGVYNAYYDDWGSNIDSIFLSLVLVLDLPYSLDDGFVNIWDFKQGVFLMFTDEMLRTVVRAYDIGGGVYRREEPYITAWKRLIHFHTFPVVPGTQGLPPTNDINLLTILDGKGTKEVLANDGWVMGAPGLLVPNSCLFASSRSQLVASSLPTARSLRPQSSSSKGSNPTTRLATFPPHAGSPRSRSQAIPALSPPRAWAQLLTLQATRGCSLLTQLSTQQPTTSQVPPKATCTL